MRGTPSTARLAKFIPAPASRLDRLPVPLGPPFEDNEGLVERPAEVGEPVEGGRLDAAGVEMADNQSVAFGSS
jgi:hypothetical protein